MLAAEIWQVVRRARVSVRDTRDIPNWLTAHLREEPVEYIRRFQEQLHELYCQSYDARLWAAAGIMLGLCSDDKFVDFRGWLISKGKRVFRFTLQNPDTLADLSEIDGDYGKPLLFYMSGVASRAYREKMADDLAELPVTLRQPVLLNQDAWDGDPGKLPAMFPKLYAKYREAGIS